MNALPLGLTADIPFGEYLASPYPGKSDLWTLHRKSPKHAKERIAPVSDALALGTVFHHVALTPNIPIAVKPENCHKGSNEGKAAYVQWLSEVTGREPISAEGPTGKMLSAQLEDLSAHLDAMGMPVVNRKMYETAMRMRDSLMSTELGRAIFAQGRPEVTCVAEDPETKVLVRSRIDWEIPQQSVLIDLKSTQDASARAFSWDFRKYGYHVQEYVYRWLYALAVGKYPDFMFVAVEKEPPFACAFYELDMEAHEEGGRIAHAALEKWAKCERENTWPGYEARIETISLPRI